MKIALSTAVAAAALFLSAGLANADSPAPAAYKAGRDFSYNNPGGVWSYGYGTAGVKESFVLYPAGLGSCANGVIDCFYDSESSVGMSTSTKTQILQASASIVVLPPAMVLMHPRSDSQETMVVFTAPEAGRYEMKGFFVILDNAPTGIAPRIVINSKDLTRQAFKSDTDVVLTGASNPDKKKVGEKRNFNLTRDLTKGQRVQFALNPAGNWTFDSTGFDVTITPVPAQ